MSLLFCNGRVADATLLGAALVNYGHFTSLQVRGNAVQGWALHVQRLQQGTRELFDAELDEAQLRQWLCQALEQAGRTDASVRITVFSRAFDFREPLKAVPVDVLIAVSAAAAAPLKARRIVPMQHQRVLPHIKHVGTFGLFQLRRQAMRQGFDDALFVDAEGRISEGTTWNLALWDGQQVCWPLAAALRGSAEHMLMDGLAAMGVPQVHQEVRLDALAHFPGAVACNASGLWPVASIGARDFDGSDALLECMQQALARTPWLPLDAAG